MLIDATELGESLQDFVSESDFPVVVYYTAPWCMPCKQLSPIISDIAVNVGDRVRFVRADIERVTPLDPSLASVPALHYYKNGQKAGELQTRASRSGIAQELEGLLP